MPARRTDVLVIGGGVVGCAILAELAGRGIEALLVEAEPDVGEGATRANSAIVHTGFDARHGSTEARLLRRARELWPAVLETLGVPFLAVGALMIARSADEDRRLVDEIGAAASAAGVRTEKLGRCDVRDIAPYLAADVVGALSIPDEGVIDPFWLTRAYAEAAIGAGLAVLRGSPVTALAVGDDSVQATLADGSAIKASQVIDAAGLRADEVARLAGDDSFEISPRKGEFLISEETYGVDRIVLPIPGPLGKGMLVTPIVFGGLMLGPTAVDQLDKDDRDTDGSERRRILDACRVMVPAVDRMRPIRQFAGLRTVSSTGDYILRPSILGDRLYLAAGIRSTGISASPSIAETVVDDVMGLRGWSPRPRTRLVPPPATFPEEPGEVVCLCRSITRGELDAACRRPLPPTTIDALKRRAGVTFGDCQGNLCLVDAARVLADARGIPAESIQKGPAGSWLFAQRADPFASPQPPPRVRVPRVDGDWDVVVIGGGRAGGAAVASLSDARTLVVDSAGGWHAVGLAPDGAAWVVDTQSQDGARSHRARAVLLSTGGFVEPREHRAIAGPRPAGVMTADLVRRALAAGFLPGTNAVVMGAGATADRVAADLAAAGCRIAARTTAEARELRGLARVEAVRFDDGWVEADTLVLADRQLPQPFLLRGLGLIDGRPDVPAPVDADGRLPLAGLWAAGCCAHPDIDHANCAADGRAVGRQIAESLRIAEIEG